MRKQQDGPLVSTDWLSTKLNEPGIRIVDASWYLPTMKRNGYTEYQNLHIPGAVFWDIDEIADKLSNLPHTLPSNEQFQTQMKELGIGDDVSGFSTEVNNVMSIFTRNDAYMLYGTSSADWELRKFHAGAGAIPYTLQKMDQTFFLDDRGITSIFTVQYFGDFQSAVASDKIDPYIQSKKDNKRHLQGVDNE